MNPFPRADFPSWKPKTEKSVWTSVGLEIQITSSGSEFPVWCCTSRDRKIPIYLCFYKSKYKKGHYNVLTRVVSYTAHTEYIHTGKKGYRFSRPQPGCHLPNSSWPGIIKLFPARESLVSVTSRLSTGKTITFFFKCSGHGQNLFVGLLKTRFLFLALFLDFSGLPSYCVDLPATSGWSPAGVPAVPGLLPRGSSRGPHAG
jgi:hypothetical protein